MVKSSFEDSDGGGFDWDAAALSLRDHVRSAQNGAQVGERDIPAGSDGILIVKGSDFGDL
jgi:hypothetical protein